MSETAGMTGQVRTREARRRPSELSEALKALRVASGRSLSSVAGAIGRSGQTISDAETGVCVPGWELVAQLAAELGGDVATLRAQYVMALAQRRDRTRTWGWASKDGKGAER